MRDNFQEPMRHQIRHRVEDVVDWLISKWLRKLWFSAG